MHVIWLVVVSVAKAIDALHATVKALCCRYIPQPAVAIAPSMHAFCGEALIEGKTQVEGVFNVVSLCVLNAAASVLKSASGNRARVLALCFLCLCCRDAGCGRRRRGSYRVAVQSAGDCDVAKACQALRATMSFNKKAKH